MMNKYMYTVSYLEILCREELLNLMMIHGYEEGYEDLDNDSIIEQLSSITEN